VLGGKDVISSSQFCIPSGKKWVLVAKKKVGVRVWHMVDEKLIKKRSFRSKGEFQTNCLIHNSC
jgi:hypothetical protein